MQFTIDRRSKYTVYFFAFCSMALLCLLAELIFYFHTLTATIVKSVIFGCFILIALVYLPLYFKTNSIRIDREMLIVNRGVIFKKEFRIKCEKILYTQKIAFRVGRSYSICVVRIHLINGSTSVYPLKSQTADSLMSALERENS